jgi:hypothetical protein
VNDKSKLAVLAGILLSCLLAHQLVSHLEQQVRAACPAMPSYVAAFSYMKSLAGGGVAMPAVILWYKAVEWYWRRKSGSGRSSPPASRAGLGRGAP